MKPYRWPCLLALLHLLALWLTQTQHVPARAGHSAILPAGMSHELPSQRGGKKDQSLLAAEAKHYRLLTVPLPKDVVLEVGGLAFRPDGKLLACTRRGEVWLIENPDSQDPQKCKFKLFATGLHEALGLYVEGKDVYCVQRPELTKLVDTDGDDVADEYITVCDKWGISGDY